MKIPTVAIVYGQVDPSAPPDERDVLVEADAVRTALHALGHRTIDVPLTLDLGAAAARLKAAAPLIAFNLAETVDGKGSLIQLAPSLLDSLRIAYTGAPCEAIVLTSHKLLAKKMLVAAGIATPPWTMATAALNHDPDFRHPWIVKSVWEHASIGLSDGSVVNDRAELAAEVERRTATEHLFVEGFVEGREFNLALLGGTPGGKPQALPPAEIQFVGFPEGKPRMVGYKAKWAEGSFEYGSTVRRADFPAEDGDLLSTLVATSVECWRLFGLRGYARVDFRVDEAGRPWVLEINTNPCISPDAGFMAAAGRAGLTIEEVVRRIVADATSAGGCCGDAEERHS